MGGKRPVIAGSYKKKPLREGLSDDFKNGRLLSRKLIPLEELPEVQKVAIGYLLP